MPMDRNGQAFFREALGLCGLHARPRQEDKQGWAKVWSEAAYQPVSYAASMIDYQHAYLEGAGESPSDASLVLLNDGQPCGVWPLTLGGPDGCRVSSQGMPVAAPLFYDGLSSRTVKKAVTQCIDFLSKLAVSLGQEELECTDLTSPNFAASGLSEWYQQWIALGASVRVRHDLYAHLEPDLADIRSTFRKSYRPLISAGLRHWQVHVLDKDHCPPDIWQSFVELHGKAAGRVTRPAKTWDLQRAMVCDGDALLVYLTDTQGGNRMVGGGFFQITRDQALYAVGAYDRDLFDKPMGHVVQARAVEEFKRRGLRWYRLGERGYPGDVPPPTDKELSIASFKQGFASHLMPRFLLQTGRDSFLKHGSLGKSQAADGARPAATPP